MSYVNVFIFIYYLYEIIGISSLKSVWISQSSVHQRTGRGVGPNRAFVIICLVIIVTKLYKGINCQKYCEYLYMRSVFKQTTCAQWWHVYPWIPVPIDGSAVHFQRSGIGSTLEGLVKSCLFCILWMIWMCFAFRLSTHWTQRTVDTIGNPFTGSANWAKLRENGFVLNCLEMCGTGAHNR